MHSFNYSIVIFLVIFGHAFAGYNDYVTWLTSGKRYTPISGGYLTEYIKGQTVQMMTETRFTKNEEGYLRNVYLSDNGELSLQKSQTITDQNTVASVDRILSYGGAHDTKSLLAFNKLMESVSFKEKDDQSVVYGFTVSSSKAKRDVFGKSTNREMDVVVSQGYIKKYYKNGRFIKATFTKFAKYPQKNMFQKRVYAISPDYFKLRTPTKLSDKYLIEIQRTEITDPNKIKLLKQIESLSSVAPKSPYFDEFQKRFNEMMHQVSWKNGVENKQSLFDSYFAELKINVDEEMKKINAPEPKKVEMLKATPHPRLTAKERKAQAEKEISQALRKINEDRMNAAKQRRQENISNPRANQSTPVPRLKREPPLPRAPMK